MNRNPFRSPTLARLTTPKDVFRNDDGDTAEFERAPEPQAEPEVKPNTLGTCVIVGAIVVVLLLALFSGGAS